MLSSIFLYSISMYGLYQLRINEGGTVSENKPPITEVIGEKQVPGIPVGILIPEIDVRADIQSLGVDTKGEMEVPTNAYDVGWFKLGSRPGEVGSAVIAGHIDTKNGLVGVFANLHRLKEGNIIYVEDDMGEMYIFIVRDIRILSPGFADDVFSRNDSQHLNLITCDGVWDKNKMSYDKRLVVFADRILSD